MWTLKWIRVACISMSEREHSLQQGQCISAYTTEGNGTPALRQAIAHPWWNTDLSLQSCIALISVTSAAVCSRKWKVLHLTFFFTTFYYIRWMEEHIHVCHSIHMEVRVWLFMWVPGIKCRLSSLVTHTHWAMLQDPSRAFWGQRAHTYFLHWSAYQVGIENHRLL